MAAKLSPCNTTELAIIYINLQEEFSTHESSLYVPGADTLANELHSLENHIWLNGRDRYLGIFVRTTCKSGVVPICPMPFAEISNFHSSTNTLHTIVMGTESGVPAYSAFGSEDGVSDITPLLQILRENGTTHVFIVGLEFKQMIAATAKEAVKHGLKVCMVMSTTRFLNVEAASKQAEQLKADKVTILDNFVDNQVKLNKFLPPIGQGFDWCYCNDLASLSTLNQWCNRKRNQFQWRICMRIRKAMLAVISAGWEGLWPPHVLPGDGDNLTLTYSGHWKSDADTNEELLVALMEAHDAGIDYTAAYKLYRYTTCRHPSWRFLDFPKKYRFTSKEEELRRLREKVVSLEAELAKLRAASFPVDLYVSDDENSSS
jgi:nicotinamidase-related amidase